MAFDYAGAKAAGYTDQEIQAYIASKKPETKKATVKKADPVNSVADFLLPQAKKATESVASRLSYLFGGGKQADEAALEAQNKAGELYKKASTIQDPVERERLLKAGRSIEGTSKGITSKRVSQQTEGINKNYDKKGGSLLAEYLKTGGRVGAEVGALVSPGGTAKQGIAVTGGKSILKGSGMMPTVARSAVDGLISGGLFKLGSEDLKGFEDFQKGALTGAATTAAMGFGGKVVSNIAKGIFEKIPMAQRASAFGTSFKMFSEGGKKKTYEDFIKKTFEKGTPADYNKMAKWGTNIAQDATEKLNRIPGDISITELFPDERLRNKFTSDANEIITELQKRGKLKEADEFGAAAYNLAIGGKTDIKGAITLKKAFQAGADFSNRAQKAVKKDERTVMSSLLTKNLKDKFPEVADLLDTQHFTMVLKGFAETAAKSQVKKSLPSLYEVMSLITAMSLSGFGSYAMSGNSGVGAAGALAPVAGIAAYRGLTSPGGAKKLYDIGQKTGQIAQDPITQYLSTVGKKSTIKGVQNELSR